MSSFSLFRWIQRCSSPQFPFKCVHFAMFFSRSSLLAFDVHESSISHPFSHAWAKSSCLFWSFCVHIKVCLRWKCVDRSFRVHFACMRRAHWPHQIKFKFLKLQCFCVHRIKYHLCAFRSVGRKLFEPKTILHLKLALILCPFSCPFRVYVRSDEVSFLEFCAVPLEYSRQKSLNGILPRLRYACTTDAKWERVWTTHTCTCTICSSSQFRFSTTEEKRLTLKAKHQFCVVLVVCFRTGAERRLRKMNEREWGKGVCCVFSKRASCHEFCVLVVRFSSSVWSLECTNVPDFPIDTIPNKMAAANQFRRCRFSVVYFLKSTKKAKCFSNMYENRWPYTLDINSVVRENRHRSHSHNERIHKATENGQSVSRSRSVDNSSKSIGDNGQRRWQRHQQQRRRIKCLAFCPFRFSHLKLCASWVACFLCARHDTRQTTERERTRICILHENVFFFFFLFFGERDHANWPSPDDNFQSEAQHQHLHKLNDVRFARLFRHRCEVPSERRTLSMVWVEAKWVFL